MGDMSGESCCNQSGNNVESHVIVKDNNNLH